MLLRLEPEGGVHLVPLHRVPQGADHPASVRDGRDQHVLGPIVDGLPTQDRAVLAREADHGHCGGGGTEQTDAARAGGVVKGEIDEDDVGLEVLQAVEGVRVPPDVMNLDPWTSASRSWRRRDDPPGSAADPVIDAS